MKQSPAVVAGWITLASLFVIPAAYEVNAQPPPAPAGGRSPVALRKVDGVKLQTPVFSFKGPSFNSTQPKNWFQVFAEYESLPDWVDELNFTFYVLVKGKTKDAPPYTLFKGETSYIHIPVGKKHTADMYLHPNIIERFGDIERVVVEVRQGGRLLERGGKPNPTEPWWERLTPVEGVLLNRSLTPFALINSDDYEIIKTK